MSDTVNLNLRLPANLHAEVKQLAQDEHRSLNAEIVYLLQLATISDGFARTKSEDHPDQGRT